MTDDASVLPESFLSQVKFWIKDSSEQSIATIKLWIVGSLLTFVMTSGVVFGSAIYFQADNNADQAARITALEQSMSAIEANRTVLNAIAQTVAGVSAQVIMNTKLIERIQDRVDDHQRDHPGASNMGVIIPDKRNMQ